MSGSIIRISDYYKLAQRQGELPFVDVDVYGDTRLFIDPRALLYIDNPWAHECISVIQDFFEVVLHHIKNDRRQQAFNLLRVLSEPNETHLGFSAGKAQGKSVGEEFAMAIEHALSASNAAITGLLEDIEDTALLIKNIDVDRISDITTNIIRGPLIKYTQEQCDYYGIPKEQVSSGITWNHIEKKWDESSYTQLPRTENSKLLFVPKSIVRHRLIYNTDEYYRHYILEYLQRQHLAQDSPLVEVLKSGRRRVTKKSLIEKYGTRNKDLILEVTTEHPQLLDDYRKAKENDPNAPLSHEGIEEKSGIKQPDWGQMMIELSQISTGKENADHFHNLIERVLTALLYPELEFPRKEFKIHEGRKRIDIAYTNMAATGFFWWLREHYTAPYIFIECKNYGTEIANPELDQMAGRFGPSKGKFGIIVCRQMADRNLFVKRCRDTAGDDRGFILCLQDQDVLELLRLKSEGKNEAVQDFFHERFNEII